MKRRRTAPQDINQYIAAFPPAVRAKLRTIRGAIRKAAPPTFTQHGNLVHFAACQHHIGFYPAPRAIEQFKEELSAYEGSKGAVRFPLDEPVPVGLIGRIVKFRVRQDRERAAARKKRR